MRRDTLETDDISNKLELAQLGRDIRYYEARLSSAILVTHKNIDKVGFGATIALLDENGAHYKFCIVGEDEANADLGKIGWTSPLATALLGCSVGDDVCWKRPIDDLTVEITDLSYEALE